MGRHSTKGYDCNLACSGTFWLRNEDGARTTAVGTGAVNRCCLWTVPQGVYCATFEVWGAGGQGNNKCCCSCYAGVGGVGGGYASRTIAVQPGWQYTLCAGGGGWDACWNANQIGACQCRGCASFVMGCGLGYGGAACNDCKPGRLQADGGLGGGWCNDCFEWGACTGGHFKSPYKCGCAHGGDINLQGGRGAMMACPSGHCAWFVSGSSGFGGPDLISIRVCCCYQCGQGRGAGDAVCGCCGSFPGGGGGMNVMLGADHCDGCSCSGMGGNGMIKITY